MGERDGICSGGFCACFSDEFPTGTVGALFLWKSDHRQLKVLVNVYNWNGPVVVVLMFQTGGKSQFSKQQNCKTDELLQKQPAKKIHFIWDSIVGFHQNDGHFQRTVITSGCYVFLVPRIKLKIRCWSLNNMLSSL